jgi:predicted PurR-regulated permease PerM
MDKKERGQARCVFDCVTLPGLLPSAMRSEQRVPLFFLTLMAGATLLLGAVIYPVATELFLATVLAGVLWPVQCWLTKRLRRRGIAAGLLTITVIVVLLGPLAMLVTYVIRDGSDAVRFVLDTARSEHMAEILAWLPDTARDFATDAIARLPRNLGEAVGQVDIEGGKAAAAAGGRFTLHAVFMLITLFFLLVRGDELVDWLDSVSPLRPGQTRELLAGFKKVSFAVIVSAVVTSAVQSLAALAGYFIARVPNPVFFALVTFFMAFIPAIGAGVVCLTAALLLFVTGHPYMAIFLAAWGLGVVGLVDNVVKPLLIKRGMELHGAVVFFSLIGGLSAFGAIGLLLGPLVVAFFLALLRMYHRDFSSRESRVPPVPGLPPAPPGDPRALPGDDRGRGLPGRG